MAFEYPENFARFYDLIYHSIRDGVDNAYYLKKIREVRGSVLEIGAGTGRLFLQALRAGADIFAIDVSASMLDILIKKARPGERDRISKQSATDFRYDKSFDLIIAPFRVFSHLVTIQEQRNALNNAWQHLVPGGTLIFDLYVPDPGLLSKGLDKVVDFEKQDENGNIVRRIVSSNSDMVNQLSHTRFRIEWTENGVPHAFDWDFDMRFYFRFEIEHLLELSKFGHAIIYGDFEENPLSAISREFIVHCKK